MSESYDLRKTAEEEMAEKYQVERIDLSYRLDMSNKSEQEKVISLMDKAVEFIPENEHVVMLELTTDLWQLPKVTVWCQSSGFDYENSQVHDTSFVSRSRSYQAQVDVRPF